MTLVEKDHLCLPCHAKAVYASQNPKLCSQCSKLLTEKSMFGKLFSEYGCDHCGAECLRSASEDGCRLCRMMLLQGPNEDEGRLQFTALYLHGGIPQGAEQTERDVILLEILIYYLRFLERQFRLDMFASALPGML